METKHLSRRINADVYNEFELYCKDIGEDLTSVLTSAIENYLLSVKSEFTVEQATYIVSFMSLKASALSPEEYKKQENSLYKQALKNLTTYKPIGK